ncbi:MAG: patatin-like phospholipase family protein [Solirubrobacteraceae bacterium]
MAGAETIALVLAGGGARGAYEIGALSALLPALEREGRRPALVIGTSVGALNAAFLGATADRPVGEVVAEGERIWREIRFEQVLSPLLGAAEARRIGAYVGEVLGLPVRATSLLDPGPLGRTLPDLVSFADLRRNAGAGRVHAAVVATSAATSRTVVFHTTGPSPASDDARGIDYVRADLGPEHVLASAAIPVAFPAVSVPTPRRAAGWYFDGGTRLNTPIKPALTLGADRVVVVGLNSIAGRPPRTATGPPDIAEGAGQLLQAVLVDPLVNDVATLASGNRSAAALVAAGAAPGPADRRTVPYVFVAPRAADAVGRLAAEVFAEHYGRWGALRRSPNVALLGRLISGGDDPEHGELLSYLFFAPEFTRALAALGRADAERWLVARHDDGIWQIASPSPA